MPDKEAPGILIARQPILDAQKRIYGYELLHHAPPWKAIDPEESTAYVLNCLVHHFSPAVLAAGRLIFVNLTPQAVIQEAYLQVPAEFTVIELQMSPEVGGDELSSACQAMRAAGYRLSLDGFDPAVGTSEALLKQADYLKFDIGASDDPERFKEITSLARPGLSVIAEHVSAPEQFAAGREAGIGLFQGYFFFKPQILSRREIPAVKMNYIRFIEAVSRPDLNIDELEKVIRQDAAISVALLRLINSAAFGLRHEVKSIKQALTLLGAIKVRRFAASLAAKELSAGKPTEIIGVTLTRAFFCESLGKLFHHDDKLLDLFMTGIISGLPTMLDVPQLTLLDELSVNEPIRDALAGKPTPMGNIFNLALAHETGAFSSLTKLIQDAKIDLDKLSHAYYEATREVASITAELGASSAAA